MMLTYNFSSVETLGLLLLDYSTDTIGLFTYAQTDSAWTKAKSSVSQLKYNQIALESLIIGQQQIILLSLFMLQLLLSSVAKEVVELSMFPGTNRHQIKRLNLVNRALTFIDLAEGSTTELLYDLEASFQNFLSVL